MKKALITGIPGQDGSYLAEFLLAKGYEVHGLARPGESAHPERFARIASILSNITLHECPIAYGTFGELLKTVRPDEIYHLAAKSSVARSFEDDFETFQTNVMSTHAALAAFRDFAPQSRFYFAATSEMYGRAPAPQNEDTRFDPVSPYAISKVAGFYLAKMYREAYGLFACSGILFNHESPRRSDEFVTQKIVKAAVAITRGEAKELHLGNLDATRDWGFAGDYVEAMWLMLQKEKPADYVIGTGVVHSVRDILDAVFGQLALDWKQYVKVDPQYVRPVDVKEVCADASRARRELGWQPKISFEALLKMMVEVAESQPR